VSIQKTGIILIAILAAGIQSGCQWIKGNGGEKSAVKKSIELTVRVVPAVRRDWVVTAPISGDLRSCLIVEIKSEVGGRLISTLFREGDFVQKDQLMAEIDPVNYRLAYDQAAAALSVAQANLDRSRVAADHARTEKERADNLLRSGGITEKDHQAATTGVRETETQVRLAEAQCEQARAALAIAEKALKDCRIVSPANGHIQKKFYDKGSLLVPGSSLYTLVDNSQLELECEVPAYRLAEIRTGQHAFFTTPTFGERRFEGTVSAINPIIEADNRSVKLILVIANPGGDLRSGMYARGEITIGRESKALVIPQDALIPEKEESAAPSVFVVREGKAHRLNIQIGGSQQNSIWVRQGLEEGDMVITEIGPALKEGMTVRAVRESESGS
jgi:membrane fusion protein (multidrug efflux system)